MAIDKIGSAAITDCTVVAADISPGSITNAKLAGSIANAKLANSTITINGTSIALGASGSLDAIDWQSVVTGDTTMVSGRGYFVNTTSGTITMTLPASANIGDFVVIKDYAGTFGSNAVTIARNGHKIQGATNNSEISTNRASVTLVYVDATKGWLYSNESNVANLSQPLFTEATGGTVATSGDFKIHTFTGDGTFAVSQIGNGPEVPTGGPQTVSYLVVAGGGAGGDGGGSGGGGGGAGGVREGRDIAPSYTASPIANSSGLTITATSFPITVGAGGPDSGNPSAKDGSPSIFSTITSAGGGGGGSFSAGRDGGSGGGAGGSYTDSSPDQGGSGNTPPVSPSQGNNGGKSTEFPASASNSKRNGGGGGGAGQAGHDPPGTPPNPGPGQIPGPATPNGGGNGVSTNITGSPVAYGGGGGGVKGSGGPGQPQGGSGGGGDGSFGQPAHGQTPSGSATAGSANTGGGGGSYMQDSPTYNPGSNSAGGKGIVVIRYKFQ